MTGPLTDQLRGHYQGAQYQPTAEFVQRLRRAVPSDHAASVSHVGRAVIRRRSLLVAAAVLAAAAVAAVPVAASTSPLGVFSRYLLATAGLGPVVERIMPTTGRATSGGYTLDLVGTYADDARTVVILKASPGASVDRAFLIGASGRRVNQFGGTSNDATGDNILEFEPFPNAGSGQVKVTLFVVELRRGSAAGSRTVEGLWTLQFTLTSQGGRKLPAPDPGQAGTLGVRFDSLVAVPGALAIDVTTVGAMPDEWLPRGSTRSCSTSPSGWQACASVAVPREAMRETVEVYDTRGNALRAPFGIGAGINTQAEMSRKQVHWRGLWTLPGPGTYRIVVRAPDGATLERVIQVR
jgi:hypothetical protein